MMKIIVNDLHFTWRTFSPNYVHPNTGNSENIFSPNKESFVFRNCSCTFRVQASSYTICVFTFSVSVFDMLHPCRPRLKFPMLEQIYQILEPCKMFRKDLLTIERSTTFCELLT